MVELSESDVVFEPITASASMQTRIDRIEHRLNLVRKIARKRAAKQKPLAERIAHGRLISRLNEEFSGQTDQAVGAAVPDVIDRAKAYLMRLDLDEPTRTLSSTEDAVFLNATIRKSSQLAAPVPAPPLPVVGEALVQIHESLVNNTIGSILAGRKMTRSELRSIVSKVKPDDEADSGEEAPDFEIDFARSRPIIFEAREGQLRIGVRGTRFAQGRRVIEKPLEIVAVYRPVEGESGDLQLQRDGDLTVNFPGTKRLSTMQAGMRGAIKTAFAKAFPESLMDEPLRLPEDSQVEQFKGVAIHSRSFDAQDGWLSIGLGT